MPSLKGHEQHLFYIWETKGQPRSIWRQLGDQNCLCAMEEEEKIEAFFSSSLSFTCRKKITHEMSEACVCLKYFYGSCPKIESPWLPTVVALASLVNVHGKHGFSKGQLRKCEWITLGQSFWSTALGPPWKRRGNSREDKARVVTEGQKKTAGVWRKWGPRKIQTRKEKRARHEGGYECGETQRKGDQGRL